MTTGGKMIKSAALAWAASRYGGRALLFAADKATRSALALKRRNLELMSEISSLQTHVKGLEAELQRRTGLTSTGRASLDAMYEVLNKTAARNVELTKEVHGHRVLAERRNQAIWDRDVKIERLEQALTDAHGVVFDLGPDPVAEEIAIEAAAELKKMAGRS